MFSEKQTKIQYYRFYLHPLKSSFDSVMIQKPSKVQNKTALNLKLEQQVTALMAWLTLKQLQF